MKWEPKAICKNCGDTRDEHSGEESMDCLIRFEPVGERGEAPEMRPCTICGKQKDEHHEWSFCVDGSGRILHTTFTTCEHDFHLSTLICLKCGHKYRGAEPESTGASDSENTKELEVNPGEASR